MLMLHLWHVSCLATGSMLMRLNGLVATASLGGELFERISQHWALDYLYDLFQMLLTLHCVLHVWFGVERSMHVHSSTPNPFEICLNWLPCVQHVMPSEIYMFAKCHLLWLRSDLTARKFNHPGHGFLVARHWAVLALLKWAS